MEKQLLEMMRTARSDGVVVNRPLEGGMELLVYPLQERPGAIIGVGYGSDKAHQVNMDDVLRRRSQDAARFGAWLPAVFRDDSRFVVMRIDEDPDERVVAGLVDKIHLAQELLS
jgi:hypothetical protein